MRKEYYIISILFPVSIINLFAQNLVPNPSFEDTLHCPTSQDQLYNAPSWFLPTANTSDYYNQCYSSSSVTSVGVPNNWNGYQYPKSGVAYSGFCCKYGSPNAREYVEIRLLDTLIANKKYCIEFYVSLSDSSKLAISNIGAYLSNDSIYETGFYIINLPYAPQVENPYNNIIYNMTGWTRISGEYTAGGGENFITIGNFRDDANTNADTLDPNPFIGKEAYYYVDDVSISLCDTTLQTNDTTIFVPNAFSPNGDGENDVFKVYGKLDSLSGSIYNRWGEEIFVFTKPTVSWDGKFNNEECPTGVYFYFLIGKDKKGKEVIRKGNLTLLR